MSSSVVLEALDLTKTYASGATSHTALRGVSLSVEEQELVTIMGPSGSGKSTLLQLLGALDVPTSGSIRIAGTHVQDLGDRELSLFRRRRLGFVFQSFHLSPMLSAEENVALPLLRDGVR